MKPLLLLLCTAAVMAAAPLHVRESAFQASDGLPSGWSTWAARDEIAPRTFIDHAQDRGGPGSLAITSDGNPAAYGGWERLVDGIKAGQWYRFAAYYRAEGCTDEDLQILARLDWRSSSEKRAGQPDYAYSVTQEGGWKKVTLDAPAPLHAEAVRIQLYLAHAPKATVWWDEVSLEEIPTPLPRQVRVAVVNFRPSERTGSREETVRQFMEVVDLQVASETDIILLPEGITVVATGKKYSEVAEPIPGPTTAELAKAARAKNAYIAAGIYERDRQTIYNTAVLLDRKGELVGKYRKVYLPREEIEGGLTPGNDYPVFETDFGKVGLMICWDVQYVDPARALALRGAELILMPIWGGNEVLGKARAIENQVFLATSGYDYPTYVLDPKGELLALADQRGSVATATIDLNRRYVDKWLGWMRGRLMKESRLDVPVRAPAQR